MCVHLMVLGKTNNCGAHFVITMLITFCNVSTINIAVRVV